MLKNFIYYALAITLVGGLYSCKNKKGNLASQSNTASADAGTAAKKVFLALKDNQLENFKNAMASPKDLEAIIKSSNYPEEIKFQMLDDIQNFAIELGALRSENGFKKLRSENEEIFGDDFWKKVEILDSSTVIISNDTIANLSKAEVNLKVKYNNEIKTLVFSDFRFIKGDWLLFCIPRWDNDKAGEMDEIDLNAQKEFETDSNTLIKDFSDDPQFENEKAEDEE
jgi:hypothetical protein